MASAAEKLQTWAGFSCDFIPRSDRFDENGHDSLAFGAFSRHVFLRGRRSAQVAVNHYHLIQHHQNSHSKTRPRRAASPKLSLRRAWPHKNPKSSCGCHASKPCAAVLTNRGILPGARYIAQGLPVPARPAIYASPNEIQGRISRGYACHVNTAQSVRGLFHLNFELILLFIGAWLVDFKGNFCCSRLHVYQIHVALLPHRIKSSCGLPMILE